MSGASPYAPANGRFREGVKRAIYGLPFPIYAIGHGTFSWARGRLIRVPAAPGFRRSGRLSTLRQRRRSDTLFVLGSGSSVNRLTDAQWVRIRGEDSVGFNFWIIHDHVPTYFVFEQRTSSERAEVFYRLLQLRARDYADVPLLMKSAAADLDEVPLALRPMVLASPTFEAPGRNPAELRRSLELTRRLGVWSPDDPGMIPTKRASISYMLFLGRALGYRQIVLLGVDLTNTRYFYEERAAEYQALGRPVPDSGQLGVVHKTLDPRVDPLTIDQVVLEINDAYLRPDGVELYIGSETSALHPALPLFTEW